MLSGRGTIMLEETCPPEVSPGSAIGSWGVGSPSDAVGLTVVSGLGPSLPHAAPITSSTTIAIIAATIGSFLIIRSLSNSTFCGVCLLISRRIGRLYCSNRNRRENWAVEILGFLEIEELFVETFIREKR